MPKGKKGGGESDDAEDKGKGKLKIIIMVLPTALLLAGVGWFLFLRGDGTTGPVTLPPPKPGPVVTLDAITINLAGGHFLKLGMTLQPTASAGEEVTGAKALDLAINEYSNRTVGELSSGEGRRNSIAELIARIKLAYLPEGHDEALREAIAIATKGSKSAAEGTASEHPSPTPSGPPLEEQLANLTAKQAIAAANALTVQSHVYSIYLTAFVMQ
jgi:flagellar FliL protein